MSRTTAALVMKAMIRISPAHLGHRSGKTSSMRASSRARGVAGGAVVARFGGGRCRVRAWRGRGAGCRRHGQGGHRRAQR